MLAPSNATAAAGATGAVVLLTLHALHCYVAILKMLHSAVEAWHQPLAIIMLNTLNTPLWSLCELGSIEYNINQTLHASRHVATYRA